MKMFNEHAETILGFIGLGAMGLPMAHNILKKGDETLLVYDVATGRAQRLAAHGALIAASPEELMRQADILFLCLPTNALVAETLEKALEHLKPGPGWWIFPPQRPASSRRPTGPARQRA